MEEIYAEQVASNTHSGLMGGLMGDLKIVIQDKRDLAQHFTPPGICNLMVKSVPTENPNIIADPAVGRGELLWHAAQKWPGSQLAGLDIDPELIMHCRSRFECGGVFECIDALAMSLSHINGITNGHLLKEGADVIISNPPFGISAAEHLEHSLLNLLTKYNLVWESGDRIKKVRTETAFFMRSYQLTRENGYIAILMPDNTISGVKNEAFRHFLLNNLRLHIVLSLPRNAFNSSEAGICLLILKKTRALNMRRVAVTVGVVSPKLDITQATTVSQHRLLSRMDPKYHLYLSTLENVDYNFKPLSYYIESINRGHGLYARDRDSFSGNTGLDYIHSTNVDEYILKMDKNKFKVSGILVDHNPRAVVRERDILLVRVGKGCVGRCAIINRIPNGGFASDCLYIIRSRRINPYYLCLFLNSSFAKAYLKACERGMCSQYITKLDLMKLPVFKPEAEMIQQLSKVAKDIHNQIDKASDVALLLSRFYSLSSQLDQRMHKSVSASGNSSSKGLFGIGGTRC